MHSEDPPAAQQQSSYIEEVAHLHFCYLYSYIIDEEICFNINDIKVGNKVNISNFMDDYKDKGLTGLTNMGNTCFMNAALQCLSHTYAFSDFLRKETYKKKLNRKVESLILMEWDKLREMMWSENCIVQPGGFFSSVQKVAKIKRKMIFTGFAQNDLPEFLTFIIDCFHSAIMREVNMKIKGSIVTNKDKSELFKNAKPKDFID